MRRLLSINLFLGTLVTLLALVAVTSVTTPKAEALSGSEFQAGRIIDDGVFYNANSMTEAQIQQFLNAKVPVCDTWHASSDPNNQPPFTCLKDYRQDTTSKPVEDGLCNGHSAGNKTSARIIYEVAQSCGVSPKVLLVLLQKEQMLVTDTWPWDIQYRSATGYGCPDTAPCDAQYYGFFNQVYNAARGYKYYAKYPSSYNHIAGRNNSILYNPDSDCGRSSVYIHNQATAGLYNYTPYQPNQAALNNLYGTGDGCSAYGNRNFWRMFSDWFGGTYADPYYASYSSQSPHPLLNPGEQVKVFIKFRNFGSASWYDDTSIGRAPAGAYPVHLATSQPVNRNSGFSADWPSPNRPAVNFAAVYESDGVTLAADQHGALPGQIVKFEFNMNVPSTMNAGAYKEYFKLVAEGTLTGAFNDLGSYIEVGVRSRPALSWYDQSSHPTINPASNNTAFLRLKNSGNTPLFDDTSISRAPAGTYPLHLATNSPLNRNSSFSAGWPSPNRPAVNFAAVYEADGMKLAPDQHIVHPGQIVKFEYKFSTPEAYPANIYREYVRPIFEGSADGYFPDSGIYHEVTVPQTAVVTYTQLPPALEVAANQRTMVSFTVKNVGNTNLPSNTKLYTLDGASFKDNTWINDAVILNDIGSVVSPLQEKTITMPLLAPDTSAKLSRTIAIELRKEDNGTLPKSNINLPAAVNASVYKAEYAGQSEYPSFTYGQNKKTSLSYRNTGNQIWYDYIGITGAITRNPYPVHLATAQPMNRISGFVKDWPSPNRPAINFSAVYESDGSTLAANQHMANPGQIVKFEFQTTPATWVNPGTYREYFQPVAEGTPDGRFNFTWTFQDVRVIPPTYQLSFVSQSTYPNLTAGQQTDIFFKYKNNGTSPWFDDLSLLQAPKNTHPVHLATSSPLNRNSSFSAGWPSPNRPAVNFSAVYESDGTTLAANQHVVQPGQIVKFEFKLTVPAGMSPRTYREYFRPILEGTIDGTLNNPGTYLDVSVN